MERCSVSLMFQEEQNGFHVIVIIFMSGAHAFAPRPHSSAGYKRAHFGVFKLDFVVGQRL